MNIWLIHIAEPLPTEENRRLMRYGILGQMMASQGHQVTQWVATFDHFQKQQRFETNTTLSFNKNYNIELLYSPGYRRHVGLKRILFHRRISQEFRKKANSLSPPDLIVSSLPTIEVSAEVVRYGQAKQVPVVLDVRDLWPDAIFHALPSALVPPAKLLAMPAVHQLQKACRQATGLMAVSPSYLQWGLAHAGRQQQSQDRVFPLGYQRKTLTDQETQEQINYWASQGVHPNRGFRCCYFGILGSSTDLRSLLSVARRYWKSGNREMQFVICGEGPNLAAYKTMSQDLGNVLFPGWVTPHAITQLMRMSDVGLAPYAAGAAQSIPNKPLEYLGGGLPVISSLRGETEDLLNGNDCGSTHAPEDAESLFQQLEELHTYPTLLSQKKTNALRLFANEFDASVVYPRMVEHLTDISIHKGDIRLAA